MKLELTTSCDAHATILRRSLMENINPALVLRPTVPNCGLEGFAYSNSFTIKTLDAYAFFLSY